MRGRSLGKGGSLSFSWVEEGNGGGPEWGGAEEAGEQARGGRLVKLLSGRGSGNDEAWWGRQHGVYGTGLCNWVESNKNLDSCGKENPQWAELGVHEAGSRPLGWRG